MDLEFGDFPKIYFDQFNMTWPVAEGAWGCHGIRILTGIFFKILHFPHFNSVAEIFLRYIFFLLLNLKLLFQSLRASCWGLLSELTHRNWSNNSRRRNICIINAKHNICRLHKHIKVWLYLVIPSISINEREWQPNIAFDGRPCLHFTDKGCHEILSTSSS